ncbi:MFS transporter [Pseudomassariella vexata]|uniref:MFS transporter n=1 Tax=Pseudomassariella vexata TaxID=1141098 RepID=A0A1Y2DGT0_9PEZI|nr:MFS transporter [Pseudomassariella vexata]ORY58459.1 MFS transporter [Pseudomassariella vexata]
MILIQVAIVLQSYFWPIYFQSVRNTTARESGINLLPSIVSNSLGTICASWFSSKSGYYVPLMWIGAPVLAAGGGLFQLIRPDSPRGKLIGFQTVAGVGYGMCSQMPILAVQVVLKKADIPTALVMVMFFQMLGGALAPSVGQNIFTDRLLRNLSRVEGIDSAAVVAAGGRTFREIVPPQLMDAVIDAFNSALRKVFRIVSWAMEWRQLPDPKSQSTEAPATEVSEKPVC